MMIPESSSCLGYCVMFLLLKALTLTSGKLMVTSPTGHSIATVSGQAELSCQLSPPQSAEHMEVLWFRGDHSKTVHLYSGGYEMKEDTSPEYVGRTELLKEGFGEGKVTLRIHNISIYDDGQYQCSFKDSGFYGVTNMNLNVIAQGVKTQIQIQNYGIGVVMVVCDSGGWYPKPNVEWRDKKGERIPHSSTSYSQDKAGLFHMTTTLLGNNSLVNLTCYISNPLTGEGRRTNIILEDYDVPIFQETGIAEKGDSMHKLEKILMIVFITYLVLMLTFTTVYFFSWIYCKRDLLIFRCHFYNYASAVVVSSAVLFAVHFIYLPSRSRVSISDPLFPLYNIWMTNMIYIVIILMAFFTIFIFGLYWTLKGYMRPNICDR